MALPTWARIASGGLLLATGVGVFGHLNRPESRATTQATDDAYVQADFTAVASRIPGNVVQVLIEDNQRVEKGDLLATLDDRDLIAAKDLAAAQVAGARAALASLEARLIQQRAAIRKARAVLLADDAALGLARVNQVRYRNLAADGSGTVQALQQADAQLQIQLATQARDAAELEAAGQQLHVLRADIASAVAAVAQAQARHAAAELQLSYTRITAPISGTIGQKAVRVGAYLNPGKPLLAVVPLDALYIVANFRETQLARVRAGQPVEIKVDALPGEMLKGTVESIGPASGVTYSAIPPHNATGNFTKIVQRLPVRIRLDAPQPALQWLRVGMSVTPTIHVGDGRSAMEASGE